VTRLGRGVWLDLLAIVIITSSCVDNPPPDVPASSVTSIVLY